MRYSYKLCDSDYNKDILFTVYEYMANGNHKKIGEAKLKFAKIIDSGKSFDIPLSKYGKILFEDCQVEDTISFIDYIMGGCEIGVHVAIDFTMSNGKPTEKSSLHYLNP